MTTFRALIAFDRARKAILWPVLMLLTCLAAVPARAEWYSFSIQAPITYVGDSVYDSVSGNSYTFEAGGIGGGGTVWGLGVDSENTSFSMELHCGSDVAYVTLSDVINAGNDGYVQLSFQPTSGSTGTVRFLLDGSHSPESLALAQIDSNGTIFNSPISSYTYLLLEDGPGNWQYYTKIYADYNPAYPFWLVDLSQRSKSPQGSTDLRYATWEQDYSQYPLMSVTLYLEGREIGHKFTVYSWVGSTVMASSVTAAAATSSGPTVGYYGPNWGTFGSFDVPAGSASLNALVADGSSFCITRIADTVSAPGGSDSGLYFVADSGFASIWSLFGVFPDPPNRSTPLQNREFRINRSRVGHEFTVWMSDGYSSHFSLEDFGYAAIETWEGDTVANPLFLLTFTAQIDSSRSWWLRDDTAGESFPIGQTDVFDNWTPQLDPFAPITLRLPSRGMDYGSMVHDPLSGNSSGPTSLIPDSTIFAGSGGILDYRVDGAILVFPNFTQDGGTVLDYYGFEWGTVPVGPGLNDLRLLCGPTGSMPLSISDSRWDHELILRHPNGDSYPIDKSAMMGVFSFNPTGGSWPDSYYYFSASTDFHPELPWYVQDNLTQEVIGPNPTEDQLISWGFTPPPTNLYMLWRYDLGVTFAWNSNGAPIDGGYTIQRKRSSDPDWIDLDQVPATSTSYTDSSLLAGVTAKYRVAYFYGNKSSGPSNELTVSAYNPAGGSEGNGNGGTGPDSGANTGGTPPPGQDGPLDDPDNDGLTNAEEIEAGTDRTKGDTDEDGVKDGQDGWPQAKHLNTPRLPVWRYAVVELLNDDLAIPVAINNRGDLLYERSGDFCYLAAGQTNGVIIENHLYTPDPDTKSLLGLADDGTVAGTWDRTEEVPAPGENKLHRNFTWRPGQESIEYSGEGCTIPPQFSKNDDKNISAGDKFLAEGITPGGLLYGYGKVTAERYWQGNYRSAYIGGFAIGGTLVQRYPQDAYSPANAWLNEEITETNKVGHATWDGSGYLINNNREFIYYCAGYIRDGDAPPSPSPAVGYYYVKDGIGGIGTLVNCGDDGMALNDDLHILRSNSILARNSLRDASRPTWTPYAAPRISRAKPYGRPHWFDFNNRLEAIGSRSKTENGETLTDWNVLINDHDYSIQDLVPTGWNIKSLMQINEKGVILAKARNKDPATTADSIVLLVPIDMAPDFNRDGVIDAKDNNNVSAEKPWRWWLNDDNDFASEVEGSIDEPDQPFTLSRDSSVVDGSTVGGGPVDGIRDLVDWFPLWLNIKDLLTIIPPGTNAVYKLKQADDALNFVLTTLKPGTVGKFLRELDGPYAYAATPGPLKSAISYHVSPSGQSLDVAWLNRIKTEGEGVLLFEGHKASTKPLVLEVTNAAGKKIAEAQFHISLDTVEKMYRHKNLMAAGGGSGARNDELGVPPNYPDELTNGKKFVWVHGYNVAPTAARAWHAEIFKRLHQSGSRAQFYCITWHGAEILGGIVPEYHKNVDNAFATADEVATFLNSLGSDVSVAGHSLGNMVVSSAIHDWGARPSHYFMIDAAVALEAYDGGSPIEPEMAHPDWIPYSPERSWASEWHKIPSLPTDDGRRLLTWRNRLSQVGTNTHNFFSASEDVLRKHDGDPGLSDTVQTALASGRHAFALQEKLKGRRKQVILGTCGSTYGGWSFNLNFWGRTPTPTEAANTTDSELLASPVFDPGFMVNTLGGKNVNSFAPPWIINLTDPTNASATASAHRNQLLAEMFPARTLPAGANFLTKLSSENYNMPALYMTDPDKWPRAATFANFKEWKHSDVKEVAYSHIYRLFDRFVELGELKK